MAYQICKDSIECIPVEILDINGDPVLGVTSPPATIALSKNGTPFAPASGGILTELGGGWYVFCPTPLQTDTVGPLLIEITPLAGTPDVTEAQVIDCSTSCDLTEVLEAIAAIECGSTVIYGVTAKGLVSSKDQILIWFTRNGTAILSGLGDAQATIYDNTGHQISATHLLKQTEIGAYRLLFDKRIKRGTYSLKLTVTIDAESRDFVQLFSLDPAQSLEVW